MFRSNLKMPAGIAASIVAAVLFIALSAFASNGRAEEDIVIVARNYLSIEDITGTGVVIGSKKGRFGGRIQGHKGHRCPHVHVQQDFTKQMRQPGDQTVRQKSGRG